MYSRVLDTAKVEVLCNLAVLWTQTAYVFKTKSAIFLHYPIDITVAL